MKLTDKQALLEWEEFVENIRNSTPIDLQESAVQKTKRIAALEADPEEWIRYYFPKFCFAGTPDFHRRSFKKILAALAEDRHGLYQVRAWARGLSKSTRRMMEVLYLGFARKVPVNMLLISKSESNAIRLLMPYKANLEANQRLINDYGQQQGFSNWSEDEFITRGKKAFRAVGAEQNPRGSKIDEVRPNVIVFDDVDDDEVCRNPDRVKTRWEWIEQAVIPTVEISRAWFIFFDNNIIAEDSCVKRALNYADDAEVINIRDEAGKSTWPEKNSEADIDRMLEKISWESAQKEYFNNPIRMGTVFKEMTYGKCPPLSAFQFVVAYADPSTSNKDRTAAGKKLMNSTKAVVLVGKKDLKYYVLKAFVDVTTNNAFTDWLYTVEKEVKGKTQLYMYIENNTLQEPFYQQVFVPLFFAKAKENGNQMLSIIPDTRKKPEKFFRIEGTLEPLNRNGLLILNEAERDNPHMQRLESQFKAVSPSNKLMDAPDAVEGAVQMIKQKELLVSGGFGDFIPRNQFSKRF